MSNYRAGIIGLGFVGGGDQVSGDRIGQQVANLDGHHREALSKHPRIDLVAGCDLDEGRRTRFAERTEARPYSDYREMLDAERLDLVSIATSPATHAELTLAAVEHGAKVVYCEKPIATTLFDAERMIDACRDAGALLVINHNRRFNPNYRQLRDRIANGDLGALTAISLRWPTGRLGCVGTHMIDAARMLTGREVVAVSGTLDLSEKPDCRGPEFHDPGGWGVLKLQEGLMAVVNAPNQSVGPPAIMIEGSEGRVFTAGDGVEIRRFDGTTEDWPSRRSEATSMDRAVGEIVAWLDDGTPFPCPAEEAARTLETIVGFHASHARNAAWTELPLSAADREHEVNSG